MVATRDTHLDAARGIGILFVIFGHLLEPTFLEKTLATDGYAFSLWRIIYAFHMPLFFVLAGAADQVAEGRRLAMEVAGAVKLVLTAFAFSLPACIAQVLAGHRNAGELLINHLCGIELSLAPLWFLLALALVRCVFACAAAMPSKAAFWSLLAVIMAISAACADFKVRCWQVHTLLGSLPFYALGRLVGTEGLTVRLATAGCGLAVLLVLAPGNLVHIASGRYGDLPTFAACALGGTCCVIALAHRLRGPTLAAAAYIGRLSFAIFVVNSAILSASPMMRAFDTISGLILLALLGIPFQVLIALLVRSPIYALRRAIDHAVDRWHRRFFPLVSA